MIVPITAYLVTKGIYDEYQPLAVFIEHAGAQEFADHHNLTTERYTADDKARSRRSTCTALGGDAHPLTCSTAKSPTTPSRMVRWGSRVRRESGNTHPHRSVLGMRWLRHQALAG